MNFFSQKLPHFWRKWNKLFFFNIRWKFEENFLDFPEITEKNFIGYRSVKKSKTLIIKLNNSTNFSSFYVFVFPISLSLSKIKKGKFIFKIDLLEQITLEFSTWWSAKKRK